ATPTLKLPTVAFTMIGLTLIG
ncbi:unnamed protein product, partial [Allacma fusca]